MHLRILFISFLIQLLFCVKSMGSEIEITKVEVGNNQDLSSFVEIDIGDSSDPVLRYNQNYLIFHLKIDSPVTGESIYYKMEGLDYNWIECKRCEQVQYAHLDGGDYTFLLKKDLESGTATQFSFQIEGNIWHQWWFVPLLLLFVLGILGIGLYFLALYKMRQEVRSQLIVHKEKLSAMVDLTAGIAHEIQNPLNFVNNYSDVSAEMIDEAFEEIENNDIEEVKYILKDLKGNLEKISRHGSRASGIVKGMLDHSKVTSGAKEPTDINALCQEYLKMSYNGLKAKDESFEVAFKADLEGSLQKIKVVPQEIGRVLLNVLNNAFQACADRKKSGADDYNPLVTLTTSVVKDNLEIRITDNGIGMSQETIDKVFQPFYTTRPTGQGIGLGMSISYDIVTKGHGGELKVESLPAEGTGMEGKGTTFIIQLPQ